MNDKLTTAQDFKQRRHEKRILTSVKESMDEQLASIDDSTSEKLALIRQQALAQSGTNKTLRRFIFPAATFPAAIFPTAMGLAASLALLVVWQLTDRGVTQDNIDYPAAIVSETVLETVPELVVEMAEAEQAWDVDAELLDELDFYAWLVMEEQHDNAS